MRVSDLIAATFGWPTRRWSVEEEIPNPQTTFGVFVTWWRDSRKHHEDVHGCIGHWDLDASHRSKKLLADWVLDAGHKAASDDPRSQATKSPVWEHPEMLVEISWMQDAWKPQNPALEFDGAFIGVLVEDRITGARATFLPHVFPDQPWLAVRRELLRKAGISIKDGDPLSSSSSSSSLEWWFYRTAVTESSLFQAVFTDPVSSYRSLTFPWLRCQWWTTAWSMAPTATQEIPHGYTADGRLMVDPQDAVRNMSALHDTILTIRRGCTSLEQLDSSARLVASLAVKLSSSPLTMEPQALAFALPALLLGEEGNQHNQMMQPLITAIQDRLMEVVSDPSAVDQMDTEFELPEILLSLPPERVMTTVGWRRMQALVPNSIFGLNWASQLAVHMDDSTMAQRLLPWWSRQLSLLQKSLSHWETNQLAVTLEGLSWLYSFLGARSLESILLSLAHELFAHRVFRPLGFFRFIGGGGGSSSSSSVKEVVRFDIGTHVFHAFDAFEGGG